ncbi:hypothetical protein [Marivirga arenosa]|uniref:Uncharacterized protein n=1 Tax=Marivirga arenosa TaxID=3059076 RepID=A0AA49GE78_9BACT|nr:MULTISPECIES: hypothetical protein [unclassified Marivirga]WKK80113.1 hypothetical protein QYS47_23355 [Marivirga sp. BKB1-2]WKK84840.1 hypothetical protein QYS48_22550 [Marivirga sp. ABR2-2]
MENLNPQILMKINELSDYGYNNNFQFENGELVLRKEEDDSKIEKHYVAEQVSVEAEYLYEDNGSAVITFMTNDGELGYAIDTMNSTGEFPLINYFEALED